MNEMQKALIIFNGTQKAKGFSTKIRSQVDEFLNSLMTEEDAVSFSIICETLSVRLAETSVAISAGSLEYTTVKQELKEQEFELKQDLLKAKRKSLVNTINTLFDGA